MNRRHFSLIFGTAIAALTLPSAHAASEGNRDQQDYRQDDERGNGKGHGNGKAHGNKHGKGYGDEDGGDRDDHGKGHDKHENQRYFRDQDQDYLVRYYNGPRDLPPGLRKKYYRNGTLPPGWQQRFRPMPQQVIVQLPPVPYGYQRGYYDGYAVVVNPRTRILYDAMDVVGALSGR